MKAATLPSPKKHVCQTRSVEAVTQHKQQKELLKWQTNLLPDTEPLRVGGSPLAITFLQSEDSWSRRPTRASLSSYLAVNLDCCRRTPGSEVQVVQNKHTHTYLHRFLRGNNDTSAKGLPSNRTCARLRCAGNKKRECTHALQLIKTFLLQTDYSVSHDIWRIRIFISHRQTHRSAFIIQHVSQKMNKGLNKK